MAEFGFEEIEHTADWALRIWAFDLEGLLRAAAYGMLDLMGSRPRDGTREWRTVSLEAEDREGLLVSWLEELLFLLETEGLTFTAFELALDGGRQLTARLQTAPAAPLLKTIKAVTYHNLKIDTTERGLEAVVVFDV